MHTHLSISQSSLRSMLLGATKNPISASAKPITPLSVPKSTDVNPEVIDALYSIHTTPYDNSFLSRLQGPHITQNSACLAVDWENSTPWMDLMEDIRDHYGLMQYVT